MAAPPVRKKPRSRWKNASRTSRWSAVSLLGAEEAMAAPAFDQEVPECVAPPEAAPQSLEDARDFGWTDERPDVDVARFTEHLCKELVAPRAVGQGERGAQLGDGYVFVPEEVRPQRGLRHVGREP